VRACACVFACVRGQVHKHLTRTAINEHSLVFEWPGYTPSRTHAHPTSFHCPRPPRVPPMIPLRRATRPARLCVWCAYSSDPSQKPWLAYAHLDVVPEGTPVAPVTHAPDPRSRQAELRTAFIHAQKHTHTHTRTPLHVISYFAAQRVPCALRQA
jgi:hypothetical protein